MNPTQVQKLILPELARTPLPREGSPSEKSSPGHDNLYETKPKYVAKRLDEDTLFESTIKPKEQLEQITEEEPPDSRRVVVDYDLEYDKFNSKVPETENIFKSEMLHNAKYKEHTKGPVIKDGLILKHSVVGTLDLFEKMERKWKRNGKGSSAI